MSRQPAFPCCGDPVVVDGVKYRIREFEVCPNPGAIHARQSFAPRLEVVIPADRSLVWDRIAGVWRVKP